MSNTGYILGVSRGHNSGICLLKDGEIVFSVEEERLSRQKYDGSPFKAMMEVLKYTDKVDYIVVVHTQTLRGPSSHAGTVEYTGDDVYTGMARKLGLIDRKVEDLRNHPQVIDMSNRHHTTHASIAFYNSGFDEAVAVIVDGAGSVFYTDNNEALWEIESIYNCSYDNGINTVFKHLGSRDTVTTKYIKGINGEFFGEPRNNSADILITDKAGIVKSYEAVTEYCGFSAIEAGKTMGLFPYGKNVEATPKLFNTTNGINTVDRNVIIPTYPNSAILNAGAFEVFNDFKSNMKDITTLPSRRNAAYWVQTSTQEAVLNYILEAVKRTGKHKVVLSGGYGLNCVANYYYLTELSKRGIELYVEPMSNDGGTAIGAALLFYYENYGNTVVRPRNNSLYLGPVHNYTDDTIDSVLSKYAEVEVIDNINYSDIVRLLRDKNIVTIYQGRSENGPRALGNRSVLFDPTFKDGKDFVNTVKRREYFRPFAASVLEEDAKEWFDLRGMDKSPHMMYAVNCFKDKIDKIPSVIHEDGTCRIQTVNESENKHYYNLIKEFKKESNVPMLFNTSFNLGGEPLVETLDDAVWTLLNSDIEYCYLPEFDKLLKVPNK